MNLVKKIDSNKITIFMEERDFTNHPEIIIENLKEIVPIASGLDIFLKLQEVNDIPVTHFAILVSFFKSMQTQGARMTIKCNRDLLYSLVDSGIGNLVAAIEEL